MSVDRFISVMYPTRPRRTDPLTATLLNTIRANTVTFENTEKSFLLNGPKNFNTLTAHLRNVDCSVAHFKGDVTRGKIRNDDFSVTHRWVSIGPFIRQKKKKKMKNYNILQKKLKSTI